MPVQSTLRPRAQQPRMQTPDIRVALSHFLRQIEAAHVRTRTQRPRPLHYNSMTGELSEFSWPCEPNPASRTPYDEIKRIAPCDLEAHRRTHRFRAPSCLCAFLDGKEYTESQIALVEILAKDEDRSRSVLNGEFVAQCAEQRCGYFLCLERFYALSNLSVHEYQRRANPLPIQDLIHISDIEKSFRRGDGLFQVMPDVVLRGKGRKLQQVNPKEAKEIPSRLIDSLMTGMSEDSFWTTFVQCMECGKVTFRQHYAVNHRCSNARPSGRHHPYRRSAAEDSDRSPRARTLARMDTVIIGDEPETRPMRSLTPIQHRASSPGSTVNYDPEDVTIPDEGSSDLSDSEFETAQEGGSDDATEIASDDQQGSWWVLDAPDLPSDDSLPDIMTVIRGPQLSRTSDVRTRVGSEEEGPEATLEPSA